MQNTQSQLMHFPPHGTTSLPSDYYDYYNNNNGYKQKEQMQAQQRSQQSEQQQQQQLQQQPAIENEHQIPQISKQQESYQQNTYPNSIIPVKEYQKQTQTTLQHSVMSPPAPPPPPAIEMIPTQMPPVMFAPTMQPQGINTYGQPQSQQQQQQQIMYQTANDNINMDPLIFPQKHKFPQSANGVSYPAKVSCPYCKSLVTTIIEEEVGKGTWFWCVVSTFFAPPFCFIPFCISNCKNKTHHCPNCEADLGHYEYSVF